MDGSSKWSCKWEELIAVGLPSATEHACQLTSCGSRMSRHTRDWKICQWMSEPKRWMLSRNCCSLLGDFNLERKSVTKSLFVDVVTGHPEVGQEKGTLLFTGISLGSFRKSLFTPGTSKLIRAILWTKLLTVIALYEKVRRLKGSSIIWGETTCRANDAVDLGMQRTQRSTMSSTQLYICVSTTTQRLTQCSVCPTLLTVYMSWHPIFKIREINTIIRLVFKVESK